MNKYEYQAALRLFRKGELWNVPTQLSAHVWDVKQHVEEMGLPPSLQYHPYGGVSRRAFRVPDPMAQPY